MGIVEDLVKKNSLKKGNYSAEMYQKEFRVGEKYLETAQKVIRIAIFNRQSFKHIMQFFMQQGHCYSNQDLEKKVTPH